MSAWASSSTAWRRSVLLTLALFAVMLRVAIPAGFMMGQAPSGAFAMVICSPDGARVAAADWAGQDGRQKAPADSQKHDSPCVFAGHGLADSPPPILMVRPAGMVVASAAPPPLLRDARPGRGLAAPPPPATGPPILSI